MGVDFCPEADGDGSFLKCSWVSGIFESIGAISPAAAILVPPKFVLSLRADHRDRAAHFRSARINAEVAERFSIMLWSRISRSWLPTFNASVTGGRSVRSFLLPQGPSQ